MGENGWRETEDFAKKRPIWRKNLKLVVFSAGRCLSNKEIL